MTGLYVREMLSRGRIRRVLVVPPAGLVGNWERELRELFRLRFRIVSNPASPRRTPDGAPAANPFRGPGSDLAIVSLDTLAGERAFDALRQSTVPPYDLVVFDEAHKLSVVERQRGVNKRRRYKLAEALAGCAGPASRFAGLGWSAEHLLLLTATPHMGRDTPYHYLWRLLDPQVFVTGEAFRRFPREARDRHFIRRTKEEMVGLDGSPLYRRRLCDTFSFALSPGPDGEQALYDATTDYLRHTYDRALDNRPAVRLAMGVFQRRLASSTLAVLRSFERRTAKIERTIDDLRSGRDGLSCTAGSDDSTRARGRLLRHARRRRRRPRGRRRRAARGLRGRAARGGGRRHDRGAAEGDRRARGPRRAGAASHGVGPGIEVRSTREVLDAPRWREVARLHRAPGHRRLPRRRLEGFGYSGHVAQIDGGLAWPAREAEVALPRGPATASGTRTTTRTRCSGAVAGSTHEGLRVRSSTPSAASCGPIDVIGRSSRTVPSARHGRGADRRRRAPRPHGREREGRGADSWRPAAPAGSRSSALDAKSCRGSAPRRREAAPRRAGGSSSRSPRRLPRDTFTTSFPPWRAGRRRSGSGYSGHVAQIHGGLAWPATGGRGRTPQLSDCGRRPTARCPRPPSSAAPREVAPGAVPLANPFLMRDATDAAGEGINLCAPRSWQFCRLMVNYDIALEPGPSWPRNAVSLSQRRTAAMGQSAGGTIVYGVRDEAEAAGMRRRESTAAKQGPIHDGSCRWSTTTATHRAAARRRARPPGAPMLDKRDFTIDAIRRLRAAVRHGRSHRRGCSFHRVRTRQQQHHFEKLAFGSLREHMVEATDRRRRAPATSGLDHVSSRPRADRGAA